MPALLGLAPGAVGLVLAMLLIALRSRRRPNLGARLRAVTAMGVSVALVIEILVLASGSWPFQSVAQPPPFEWLSSIPGQWQFAAPLAAGLVAVAAQAVPAPSTPASGQAALTRRTPFAFTSRRWLIVTGALVAVSALSAVVGGLASQPDEDGNYTMWLQDAGLGTIGTLIYGWHYSIPNLLLLLLLAAVTLITLALIARPPIANDAAGDLEKRRLRSRNVLASCCGALMLHLGAVFTFFAFTANLNTGTPVGDAVIPLYPPFAALAPVLIIVGIAGITAGLTTWFTLLLEQLRVAATRRAKDSAGAR